MSAMQTISASGGVFFALAAALTLIATATLVLPLLRSRGHHGQPAADAQTGANLIALRAQAAALDARHAQGELSTHDYEHALRELRERALSESAAPLTRGFSGPARGWATAVGISLPLLAGTTYMQLGAPQWIERAPWFAQAAREPTAAPLTAVEAMVNQLAAQLSQAESPAARDAGAWAMLAGALASLRRFPEADAAYQRALALNPTDPDLLASLLTDRADVLRMLQGAHAAGEPQQLIDRALQVAPRHPKALALAGSAAFERRDYAAAVALWTRALQSVPAQSPFAQEIARNLEQARDALAAAGGQRAANSAAGMAVLRGRLEIAPALRAKADPDAVVFVVARAAQGPRMPLALAQFRVRDLPLTFTLDDRHAMTPGLSLSQYPEVVLSARISRDGSATPRSGDLAGTTALVRTGAFGIVVRIDTVQP
ncbi:MAG: c-type cytochrome biogenesis protein CcmI [Betaproteobacteria bacterium]|nr:c-type cytochrome biogenesis protein CcmI [Betaproteobacteria bacterium]NBS46612.1 c-type cytochrome biogenesis protein CcmI [Betaproteobacteria bacterium]